MTPADWWTYGSAAGLVYLGGALLAARYAYQDSYNGRNHDTSRMIAAWVGFLWPLIVAVIVAIGVPCGIGWLIIILPYKAGEWLCRKWIVEPVQAKHRPEPESEPEPVFGEPTRVRISL